MNNHLVNPFIQFNYLDKIVEITKNGETFYASNPIYAEDGTTCPIRRFFKTPEEATAENDRLCAEVERYK